MASTTTADAVTMASVAAGVPLRDSTTVVVTVVRTGLGARVVAGEVGVGLAVGLAVGVGLGEAPTVTVNCIDPLTGCPSSETTR